MDEPGNTLLAQRRDIERLLISTGASVAAAQGAIVRSPAWDPEGPEAQELKRPMGQPAANHGATHR